MSTLAQDRVEFSRALGKLLRYADANGYLLALDEGRVIRTRKGRAIGTGKAVQTLDAMHIEKSKHYDGLAQDTVLYKAKPDGSWEYVSGDDPIWRDLGRFWKMCDPRCSWGGDFAKVDLNHFSFGE